MEDLGATGSPMLQRSMTERHGLSPQQEAKQQNQQLQMQMSSNGFRKSLKDELDFKKVRLLELETENGEMKTLIEQMTREMQNLKDQTQKNKIDEANAAELDQNE